MMMDRLQRIRDNYDREALVHIEQGFNIWPPITPWQRSLRRDVLEYLRRDDEMRLIQGGTNPYYCDQDTWRRLMEMHMIYMTPDDFTTDKAEATEISPRNKRGMHEAVKRQPFVQRITTMTVRDGERWIIQATINGIAHYYKGSRTRAH